MLEEQLTIPNEQLIHEFTELHIICLWEETPGEDAKSTHAETGLLPSGHTVPHRDTAFHPYALTVYLA